MYNFSDSYRYLLSLGISKDWKVEDVMEYIRKMNLDQIKKFTTFNGNSFFVMQIIALVVSIVGIFIVDWSLLWIIVGIFFFYLYGVVGMGMMLHRFCSHKSFQFKNKNVEKFFTFVALISSRGSPLAWVHIHRMHHAYSDTEKDPHRPENFSLFSFKTTYIKEIKLFLIRDLMTKEHKFYHEYYFLILGIWCLTLFLISPYLFYFAWALPVFLNQISQDLWNYYSHVNVGYRNFNTKDNSRNVFWLWPLVLGEAWHNNHHNFPNSHDLTCRPAELDPINLLIQLVKE